MATDVKKEIGLEIGHVLFIDIVGYSKLLINEQSEQLQTLKEIVRETEQFRRPKQRVNYFVCPPETAGHSFFATPLKRRSCVPWRSRRR